MKKISLLLFLGILAGAASAATLELKPVAEIHTSEVRLMDILASSTDVPRQILEATLCSAPAPGQERMIYRVSVQNAIRNWAGSADAEWTGAAQCKIVRPGRTVSMEEIKGYLQAELQKRAGSAGKARVVDFGSEKDLLIPSGNISLEIELSPSVMDSEWSNAMLRFNKGTQTVAAKSIRFRWALEAEVWKSNRALKVGDVILAENFSPYTCNVFVENGQMFTGDISQLDAVAARPLSEGGVLMIQHIKNRTLVKRGAPVVVNYRAGSVVVVMHGTALDNGAKGQVVSVRNDASKKKVFAKVTDEGVLEYVQ